MRVPQVSERIKEAPAQALRGVFAGIGQLLLITDKLRNKPSADQDVLRARTPQASETITDTRVTVPGDQGAGTDAAEPAAAAAAAASAPAAAAASAPAEAVSGGETAEAAEAAPVAAGPGGAGPGEAAPAKPPKRQSSRDFDKTGNVRLLGDGTDSTARDAAAPGAAAPGPAGAGAPIPNYDELSVPSLRARLRNLDVTQVRQLAEYERAHAARADVLTMLERRIAKLEAEA